MFKIPLRGCKQYKPSANANFDTAAFNSDSLVDAVVTVYRIDIHQGSATCGTRAKLGTASNFQWQAETPSSTYQFCYDSQEVLLTLTSTKMRM